MQANYYWYYYHKHDFQTQPIDINPLNPELNPICYLLALLGAHHFSTLAG